MNGKKERPIEATGLNVINLQVGERTKQEIAFDRSMDDLVDTMRELVLVEQLTGRAGLPQRVYLAFRLRGAKKEERENDVVRICGAHRL